MRYFDSVLLLHNQLQRGRNTWDSLKMDDLSTVAYMWGIGKVTVVKVLSSGKQLRKLGDLQIQMVVPYLLQLVMDHWDQPT